MKRLLRYIKGMKTRCLNFVKHDSGNVLVGFSDADFAGHVEDRRSTSGYIFKAFGNTICWASKKQTTVSL